LALTITPPVPPVPPPPPHKPGDFEGMDPLKLGNVIFE